MTDTGPDKPQDDPPPEAGETPAEAGDSHAPAPDPAEAAPGGDGADVPFEDAYADDSLDSAPAGGSDAAKPAEASTGPGGASDDNTNDWDTGYDNYDEWNEGQYNDWGDGFDGQGWRDDDTPDDGYDDHYQEYDYDHDTELTTWQDDNEPARPDPADGSDKAPAKAGGGTAVATADEDEEDEELDPEDAELARSTMSLGEHLEELRTRLIKALVGLALAMVGTCIFGKQIFAVLKSSYVYAMEANGLEPIMQGLAVHEAFLTFFKISLIAGMVLASPWVFYQLWQFIAAGLYKRERRYVTVAVPFSATLFISGAAFFLLVVSKPMLLFFIGFSKWMGVTPAIRLKEYISFITMLMLVFGLSFQTPLVVFLLGKMGLVSLATLRRYRRHVIVVILVLAALFTSPSPIDQVLLAVPMYLLYEMGVFMVALSDKKKREREAAEEEEDRLRSEELARERGEET